MGTMPFLSVAPGLSGWVTASVDLSIFNFRISACQNDNNPGKGEAAIHSIVVTVNKMGQISIDNLRLREGGTTVSECAEMVSNYSVSKWHCLVDNMVVIPEGVTKTYTVNAAVGSGSPVTNNGLNVKIELGNENTPGDVFWTDHVTGKGDFDYKWAGPIGQEFIASPMIFIPSSGTYTD